MKKVRLHYKYCRTAGFLTVLTFIFAILSVYEPRLTPLFIVTMLDLILTVIPAYYITIEDMKEKEIKE